MRVLEAIPTLDELRQRARRGGIDHLGVAPASVLARARTAIADRQAAGFDADMGFTYRNPDRSTDPARAVEGARSVIVAARSYAPAETPVRPTVTSARVARYAWSDHYGPLRATLRDLARLIRRSGERAVAFADDNSMVDREIAYRGGLGWFGKNANLLLPGGGSYFVLGSIVTTAAYEVSPGPVADGCGSCRRCLDACPTGAITAPGVVDANRCIAWVLQRPGSIDESLRAAIGDRIYGCDDCQEACPPTVRFAHRHARTPETAGDAGAPTGSEAFVDVLAMLEADDATLLERHGRWYLSGRDPRWLRRNALVVLGNLAAADPAVRADPRVRDTFDHYIHGEDAMLAEHARWAAAR